MMGTVIPVTIVVLCCGSYLRKNRNRGVMTPERMKIYSAAISGALKDPASLDRLANAFAGEGLSEQAVLLRKRAILRRLSKDVKEARRAVWKKAMQSKNKTAVFNLAAEYDKQGCTAAAMRLREYASGLPDKIPDVVESTPVEPSAEEPSEDVSAETADT